jgi:dTDP-glucose 4,6-dehydratase
MNFQERYDNQIVRVRLFNAYGPGEWYHPYRSVVCLFCYRALHNLPFDVYRGYSRVFMYIDDLIPTLANITDYFVRGSVYNIGGTEYRSVEELADLVVRETGFTGTVNYKLADAHNRKSKRPHIDFAINNLSHNPTITLEQGVPRTIEWMREVYRLPMPSHV